MIIIITGASHTGKTLLAQRMLEKYKYPYLSADHLKMGLIRSGSTDLTPEELEVFKARVRPLQEQLKKKYGTEACKAFRIDIDEEGGM